MPTPSFFSSLLAAFALVGVTVHAGNSKCCDALRAAVSAEKILGPTSTNYTAENSEYWSPTCVLTPECIFVPTSSSDVSLAVKTLVKNACQFATRGGGHTANPGWAGTSFGVLISLSQLNAVQVNKDATRVVVGAGNRWESVYAEVDKHGVTVAGGRVSKVGVSGFLLGGGLSFLMHQVGFSANSVSSYEIVLANGAIVNATKSAHSDLFKALKGGTGNFGIVTSFELETYPVHDVYGGNLYYAPSEYDKLYPLMESYARKGPDSDPKSHIIFSFGHMASQSIKLGAFYNVYSAPVTAPPPVLKPFMDIPTIVNTVGPKTFKGAVDELTGPGIGNPRSQMHAYSIRADAKLFKQLTELWSSTSESMSSTPGWLFSIIFQVVSNTMIKESDKRGGNVLGLQPSPNPLMIVSYQASWSSASDDGKVYAAVRRLADESRRIARSQGKLLDYIYLNYADAGQPVIEAYGQAQVQFLQRIRAKYDPTKVFKSLSPGGFKVPS